MKTHLRWSFYMRAAARGSLLVVASCSTPRDRDVAKTASGEGPAKGASPQPITNNASAEARAFVDAFYKWYAPIAGKTSHVPPWYAVLDQRPVVLGDTLLRALRRDREEQSRAVGEIVGLDFDPFLGAQDPCERYVTGDSVQAGDAYRVSVFGVCGKARHSQADVIAEVARRDTMWVFVDFYYPGADGGNLLGMLSNDSTAASKK
jgi:hypothetical protein